MDIAIVVLAGVLTGEVYPANRCLEECRKNQKKKLKFQKNMIHI
jgi:hypothetical protein